MLKNKKKLIMIGSPIVAVLVIGLIITAFATDVFSRDGDDQDAFAGVYEDFPNLEIAPSALGRLSIEATSLSALGVATDTSFLITSENGGLTAEHLMSYLSVRGGGGFSIAAHGADAFLLTLDDELEPNAIVNLIYRPPGYAAASHAFQTQDSFRVTATTPAHGTHGIPANTGVEVTFSQPLEGGLSAFEDAFQILPAVEGRFLQRGNTYIFAPDRLEYDRTYVVTVRRGLVGESGDELAEDYTFAFATTWGTGEMPLFSVAGSLYETFLPWNEVFIGLHLAPEFNARDFIVNIYEMPDADSFLNFGGTENATHFGEFEVRAEEFYLSWWSIHYLMLGQTLPPGMYVAEIRSAQANVDLVEHKFIQVSPLSVYSISVDGSTVFWLNDADTGLPAAGARVYSGEGVFLATADADGLAVAQIAHTGREPIIITHGGHTFVYSKRVFAARTPIEHERFLSYMYTDRPTYRPNDTIDVFGVIKPREGESFRTADRFVLRIGDILSQEIFLDEFNSFAVRIPVQNMFGFADIRVEVNGEHLMGAWVNFFDYTNLPFQIEGTLDRLVYEPGDAAQVEISVTTFTGRPAEDILLQAGWGGPGFTTNEYGIAAGSLTVDHHEWNGMSWEPYWNSFWFNTASGVDISQHISLPYIIVPRDIMLENWREGDTILVHTHEILIDRIEEVYRDADPWHPISPDTFRGEPVDIDFEVIVTRNVTTRTLRRTQYDHINRRTVNFYEYNTRSYGERPISGRTVDGVATVTGLPSSDDPLIGYTFEIVFRDRAGRRTTSWVGGNWWWHHSRTSVTRHFHFQAENHSLNVGESTRVSLIESDDAWWWDDMPATPLTDGRMLVVMVRDGLISAQVGSPEGIYVTLTEDGISNVILYGAYFDGEFIFPVDSPLNLNFDYRQRELEISLGFDAEIYAPGDEVIMTIQTAPNARVLISVIDESSLQHSWHEANFLSRLYRSADVWRWGMNVSQFASHTQHAMNFNERDDEGILFSRLGREAGGWAAHATAEMAMADSADDSGGFFVGSGIGAPIDFRDFFMDNPIFETVTTDANGFAELTFTLADQVTLWRVTALAITADGYAGDTRESIVSSLDFYVDTLMTNEFIEGDDIAVLAMAFGQTRGAEVDFIFNVLRGDEIIFTDTQTTTVGEVLFNAGKLPVGEYRVQIIATLRENSDEIVLIYDAKELPLTVAESGLIIRHRVTGEISPDSSDWNPAALAMRNMPVRVTLINANILPLTNILNNASNARSFRTDYIAAAEFANYFFWGEKDIHSVRSVIHGEDGGIPELTYERSELFYTARFAASFPEFVDRNQIIEYVYREMTVSETPMRRAVALLALAGIGEPVLLEIREKVAETDPADSMLALYLTAALIAIGDDAGAAELFSRINLSHALTGVDYELAETLIFFINTTINPSAAWTYVTRRDPNRYVSDVPERINFVRRVRLLGGTVSEVSYTLDGVAHTARLENFDIVHMHILYEQFHALNLTPISGETKFQLDFFTYDSSNWNPDDNVISVSRTIEPEGDLMRITLTVTLPQGTYGAFSVYDRLPSNLRFVPNNHRRGTWRHADHFYSVRHTQRQLVELCFFNCRRYPVYTRTLTYYAMELFEADMADGVTYVTGGWKDTHVWGSTR